MPCLVLCRKLSIWIQLGLNAVVTRGSSLLPFIKVWQELKVFHRGTSNECECCINTQTKEKVPLLCIPAVRERRRRSCLCIDVCHSSPGVWYFLEILNIRLPLFCLIYVTCNWRNVGPSEKKKVWYDSYIWQPGSPWTVTKWALV